ncbi:MAG TPA: NAD-dependent epimerase/dehydratase family protein [Solirubrobacteraceae bacterium]|nr:NAD-dependent epimerase/dehydratase family protein [Solirubrobacteraceae bacterium]
MADGDAVTLVTGGTGFIGGRLVARLVRDGHRVRCLVRPSADTSALTGLGVDLSVGDLTDPASLRRAVDGCRDVVHCAAMVTDWALPGEVRRVNVDGTRALLEASAAVGLERFVHISSTDVYGHPGGREVDETHRPGSFRNWYAQTKLAAEAEVRRAAAAHRLATVILRPGTVYGPGSREVVLEIARAIRGRHMVLIGDGRAVAGLCYVENLVDAVLAARAEPAVAGAVLNVVDGVEVTWRGFVDDLAAGLGCPPVRWSIPYRVAEPLGLGLEQGYRLLRRMTGLRTRPLLSRQAVQVMGVDQRFSNRGAREQLGWEPRVGYAAGLAATLDWLRAVGV